MFQDVPAFVTFLVLQKVTLSVLYRAFLNYHGWLIMCSWVMLFSNKNICLILQIVNVQFASQHYLYYFVLLLQLISAWFF